MGRWRIGMRPIVCDRPWQSCCHVGQRREIRCGLPGGSTYLCCVCRPGEPHELVNATLRGELPFIRALLKEHSRLAGMQTKEEVLSHRAGSVVGFRKRGYQIVANLNLDTEQQVRSQRT